MINYLKVKGRHESKTMVQVLLGGLHVNCTRNGEPVVAKFDRVDETPVNNTTVINWDTYRMGLKNNRNNRTSDDCQSPSIQIV